MKRFSICLACFAGFTASLPISAADFDSADRRFLYAIQHGPSGAFLFLGRVTDPR
jgi:serine protease inhibitor